MFKNIFKEKELIDRELAVYRKEKMAEIAMELSQSYLDNRKQISDNEHSFHQEKEDLGIELATMRAKIEGLQRTEKEIKEEQDEYYVVLAAKDEMIKTLKTALSELTEKISPTYITNNNK